MQGRNVLFLLLEGCFGEEFNPLSAMHCSHQRGKGVWVRNLQPMGFTLILLLAPVVRSNKWKCATRNWYDSLFLLCKLTTCGRGNPMVMCAGEAHLREGCYHYAHHNTVAGTTKGENPAL